MLFLPIPHNFREDKAKGRLIEDKVKVKWLTMDGFAKRKKRCLMAYVLVNLKNNSFFLVMTA